MAKKAMTMITNPQVMSGLGASHGLKGLKTQVENALP
jgi:hypothetical protein